MKRIGILLSGRGSNFQAIHRAVERGEVQAEIACVISNVPDAGGVAYAREKGLPVHALSSRGVPRAEFDQQVIRILNDAGVDLVCLAGYMRLLSKEFIAAFAGRIVNIHPSLLPAFPGLHAQKQAFDAGVKVTGCTVHWVDEGLDTGPIIAQAEVTVQPDDTEETLSARILEQEHRLYPATIQAILHLR
ncbi:MAG: phosphoribosylglycinamide formyltransferase [Acidobacteria bacterium]|nr:phosphoribosylglycinamide formyltransferase [Acidobacteriota bacterium]